MAEEVGLSGGLFAKASGVTNEEANRIAKFRGGWTAEIAITPADWFGQNTVRQAATVTRKDVVITIDEVAFLPLSLETLWGLTKNGSDNLKSAGAEAATSYTLKDTTTIPELEYLVECKLGGKTFQAYSPKAIALGTTINFTNEGYVVQNLPLLLIAASGDLVEYIIEN